MYNSIDYITIMLIYSFVFFYLFLIGLSLIFTDKNEGSFRRPIVCRFIFKTQAYLNMNKIQKEPEGEVLSDGSQAQ